MALRRTQEQNRLTIYVGGVKKRALIDWAKKFTQASSDSEAIFSALELLKEEAGKARKKEALKAFARVRGAWANIPRLDKIFQEIDQGWADWKIESH